MKKILAVVLTVPVIFAGLVVAKDAIIKSAVVMGIQQVTGTAVEIDKFSLGLWAQKIHIEGLRVYNPEGFPEAVLLNVPQVAVDYDLQALLKKTLHLPLLRFNLQELTLVKNREGELNVDFLKVTQKAKDDSKKNEVKKPEMIPMRIDTMQLTLGRVILKDYSRGKEPKIQVFDVGVRDKTYKNITSANQLATLVLVEGIKPTAIKSAAVYGAAAFFGVGLIPVGVATVLLGNDVADSNYGKNFDQVYRAAVEILTQSGTNVAESKDKGAIKATVDGCGVTIRIDEGFPGRTKVSVSARKFLIPRPDVAKGILYKLSEKLK